MVYSSHDSSENCTIKNISINNDDLIEITFNIQEALLVFKNHTRSQELNLTINIPTIHEGLFYPCVCMRSPGETVTLEDSN